MLTPHCVPDDSGISAIRSLPESAMYKFPAESSVNPVGPFSSDVWIDAPLPEFPATPSGLPAIW